MAELNYEIYELSARGLTGFEPFGEREIELIDSTKLQKTFKAYDNFIELSYFNLDDVRLQTVPVYNRYSVLSGDTIQGEEGTSEVSINVLEDYKQSGYNGTDVKLLYNFLDYPYSSTSEPEEFFIDSISPDRSEIRLKGVESENSEIERITDDLIQRYSSDNYQPDLHLYFGNNVFFTVVNVGKELNRDTGDVNVLLKLYQPLPSRVSEKAIVNVAEKISNSFAFEINTTIIPEALKPNFLRSANYDIEIDTQSAEPSRYFNYNELFSFPTNNTYRELNSLFNEKGAELGIDYSDFSNFINFSSAEERLRNFKYKLDLIDSYQGSLDALDTTLYSGAGAAGSSEYYKNLIDGIINNFDHYERHLYFDNKTTSWPKTNSTKPYINALSNTAEATTFFTKEIEDAILFDSQNNDTLIEAVPSFLREDGNNRPYELFVHMIAQHFDNLWIYTNRVSEKYNADNRLNIGVSKDLLEELLKNFGVKLYTSNKSTEELYKYFTFNSYDVTEEYLPEGIIDSGEESVSQNNYQKEIYKRIYHNLPLLMKSKGTERGLRALINCFGIPSEVLKVKIYGGQSYEDLPYFGGEQEFTSSIDKIRLNNTGSIVPGSSVSYCTSVVKQDDKYTQDLHRVEVGFSPVDNINAYIVSQSQELFPNNPINIDEYIGDPRENNTNRYSELFKLSKTVLEDVDQYRLKDFIRLIKFFDNVIFRMVKDFIPGRNVTDSGIIIKPHLLERNKVLHPEMTWTRPEYSGSIDTAFISASHGSIYDSGSGERSTAYSSSYMTPTGKVFKFWEPTVGNTVYEKSLEEAKFDGELSGSKLLISTGEMNDDNTFKEIDYADIKYNVRFFKDVPAGSCVITGNSFITRDDDQNFIEQFLVTELFNDSTSNFNFSSDGEVTFDSTGGQDTQATITFTEQYEEVTITATDPNTDSNPDVGGIQPCTANSTVTLVRCNATTNPGADQIQTGLVFDLNTLFLTGDNTDYSIIVNGTELNQTQAANFTFDTTDQTIPQTITLVDNVDNSCQVIFNTTVDSCPLDTPITDTREWLVYNRNKYPALNPESQARWGGDEFFNLREIFPGSNADTVFEIRFDGQFQGYGSEWITAQTYSISGNNIQRASGLSGEPFFPTNFTRLADDYNYFMQNYTVQDGNNGGNFNEDGSVALPHFAIFFRAVQNAACVENGGAEGGPLNSNVKWDPFQDQWDQGYYDGPLAAYPLYPVDFYRSTAAAEPTSTTPDQSSQDEPFGDYEAGVCTAVDQGGNLGANISKVTLYSRVGPSIFNQQNQQHNAYWNEESQQWAGFIPDGPDQGAQTFQEERAIQTQIIRNSRVLFSDARGFNIADSGVYTDYAPTSQGQGQDQQSVDWGIYDYLFRPNPPNSSIVDPFVSQKSWAGYYGNQPGGQQCIG